MKFGLNVIHVWNVENPAKYILDLAVAADEAGWEGFFLWDHITWSFHGPAPVTDPWMMLGGIATRTKGLQLGTIVTPYHVEGLK